jgi:hypothetical protein
VSKNFLSEPALGGFVVSMAAKTLISTRLSGVSADTSYILKTDAKPTRGIAKMVLPVTEKYRNLRNFIRAERLCIY